MFTGRFVVRDQFQEVLANMVLTALATISSCAGCRTTSRAFCRAARSRREFIRCRLFTHFVSETQRRVVQMRFGRFWSRVS